MKAEVFFKDGEQEYLRIQEAMEKNNFDYLRLLDSKTSKLKEGGFIGEKVIELKDPDNKAPTITTTLIFEETPENFGEVKEKLKKKKQKEQLKAILHPGLGKLISSFAVEVADVLKDKNILFYRIDSRDIIEIGKIKLHKDGKEKYTGFISVKPNRFITLVEKYIIPGVLKYIEEKDKNIFQKKSIGSELSNTLLYSEILQQALPQINRIFTIPIPILYEGKLTFPKKGYDERFLSWLPYDAPEISNPEMSLEEAKDIIYKVLKEFCFQSKQDYINAIASMITPYLKGLYITFNARTPVFFYLGNRERIGKDYAAKLRGIIYEGYALEDSPISTSENIKSNNTDELRKKILAAMISGRKMMHFSNNKGYINNAAFEMIVTAEKYTDRLLGKNELLAFDNELDFSLSGNTGIGFTPDFANRCRFIRLFLDLEDANARKFENPNLHNWTKENRGLILSALYSLVKNWVERGMVKGNIPFTSFPEWARVCGGVMEVAGYDSPCAPDKETISLGGDSETMDMKLLFELCYEKKPEQWMHKSEIKELVVNSDANLFSYLDFTNKSDQIKFGNKILKFVGRVLSDIRLVVKDSNVRAARQEFKFTKEKYETDKTIIFGRKDADALGNDGNVGNDVYWGLPEEKSNIDVYGCSSLPTLPRLPQNEPNFGSFGNLGNVKYRVLTDISELMNPDGSFEKAHKTGEITELPEAIASILLNDKKIEIAESKGLYEPKDKEEVKKEEGGQDE